MATTHHEPGSFCWFECGTTDAAATTGFYKQLFGWNSADVPMPGEMEGNYTLLKIGDDDIAGLYPFLRRWAFRIDFDDDNARDRSGDTIAFAQFISQRRKR